MHHRSRTGCRCSKSFTCCPATYCSPAPPPASAPARRQRSEVEVEGIGSRHLRARPNSPHPKRNVQPETHRQGRLHRIPRSRTNSPADTCVCLALAHRHPRMGMVRTTNCMTPHRRQAIFRTHRRGTRLRKRPFNQVLRILLASASTGDDVGVGGPTNPTASP